MPTYTMTADTLRVVRFVQAHQPLALVENMKAIGLERDGELVAGVVYEGYNGHNIWMHIAIAERITKDSLRYAFHYPFVELGCSRVSGYVQAKNSKACSLCERLGFRREAILSGAASDGGDVIIYTMKKKECKHVALAQN